MPRYFFSQIKSMATNGENIRVLLSEENNLQQPKALAVVDSRLFYLDPIYDKIERVDLPTGENPKLILDNEVDLKTFVVFKKRLCELLQRRRKIIY